MERESCKTTAISVLKHTIKMCGEADSNVSLAYWRGQQSAIMVWLIVEYNVTTKDLIAMGIYPHDGTLDAVDYSNLTVDLIAIGIMAHDE